MSTRGDLGPGARRPASRGAAGPRTPGAGGGVCVPGMQKLTSPRRGFDFAPGGKGETGPKGRDAGPRQAAEDGRDSGPPAGGQRCWLIWSGPLVAAMVEASEGRAGSLLSFA